MRKLATAIAVLVAACLPPTEVFVRGASPLPAAHVTACVARVADSLGYKELPTISVRASMQGFPYLFARESTLPSDGKDTLVDNLDVSVKAQSDNSTKFSVTGTTYANAPAKYLSSEGDSRLDTPSQRVMSDTHTIVARCASTGT